MRTKTNPNELELEEIKGENITEIERENEEETEKTLEGECQLLLKFIVQNKLWLGILFGSVFTVIIIFTILLSTGILFDMLDWIDSIPFYYSSPLFLLFYIIVSYPPSYGYSLFTLGAGFVYGLGLGVGVVIVCSIIGAIQSFFICRKYFKESVNKMILSNEYTTALMILFESNQIVVIWLLYFTPVTHGLTIGFLSITDISFPKFIFWNTLAAAPYQVLATNLGASASQLTDITKQTTEQRVLLIVQIVVSFVLLVIMSYYGRKTLRKLQKKRKLQQDQQDQQQQDQHNKEDQQDREINQQSDLEVNSINFQDRPPSQQSLV